MAISKVVGAVRESISALMPRVKGRRPTRKAMPTTTTTPIPSARRERFWRDGEPRTIPSERPRIGPISGAMIIAPMTTAVLFARRPKAAMRPLKDRRVM